MIPLLSQAKQVLSHGLDLSSDAEWVAFEEVWHEQIFSLKTPVQEQLATTLLPLLRPAADGEATPTGGQMGAKTPGGGGL